MVLIIKFFAKIIGFLPQRLFYLYSSFIAWVLEYVVQYRRKVINKNLKIICPSISNEELTHYRKKFYLNFSDTILETINLYNLSQTELENMVELKNVAVFQKYENQKVILATSHLCNWELAGIRLALGLKNPLFAVYKPLSNKKINFFFKKLRAKFNLNLVPMNDTALMMKQKEEPLVLGLISDQSPLKVKTAFWINFFNKPTGFLPGPELLSRMHNCPVIYCHTERVHRGKYILRIKELVSSPQNISKGEITRKYAKELEKSIELAPYNWLLTHRRWKRTMPENTRYDFTTED